MPALEGRDGVLGVVPDDPEPDITPDASCAVDAILAVLELHCSETFEVDGDCINNWNRECGPACESYTTSACSACGAPTNDDGCPTVELIAEKLGVDLADVCIGDEAAAIRAALGVPPDTRRWACPKPDCTTPHARPGDCMVHEIPLVPIGPDDMEVA